MYKKSLYLFIANTLNRALNFILRIVLRIALGSTGFGIIAVILPVQNLILTITSYAVTPTVSKYVSEDRARQQGEDPYPFLFAVVGIILFAAGMVLAPAFASFLSPQFEKAIIGPLRIMFAVIPIGVVFSVLTGIFFGRQRAAIVAGALFLVQVVTVASAYVLGISLGVDGAVFAFIIAYAAGIAVLLVPYLRSVSAHGFDWTRARSMLRFSLPMLVTSLGIVTLFQADIIVLGRYYGPDETAVYGLVAPTSRLIPSFAIALSMMLLPRLSELTARRSTHLARRTVSRALSVTAIVSLPLTFSLMAFSEEVLFVLFDTTEAVMPLRILAFGMLCYSLFYVLSSSLQGYDKPHVPMYALSVCAVLDVVLCFMLIPRYGILGASVATGASLAIVLIVLFSYVRPSLDIPVLNMAGIIPLVVFEHFVGIVGGPVTTVVIYGLAATVYMVAVVHYNGLLALMREE
ncbi:flippase [archaeon]|nr:MAG: flippase [archaeon]